MCISDCFSRFCTNIRMDTNKVAVIQGRYHRITSIINKAYWNSDSDIKHSLYAGSYGRGTKCRYSDIDILVELPTEFYRKYNNYKNNGQSALIQHVKNTLGTTYSTSSIRGDGQVINISFSDGISFEIVPVFLNTDGLTYTYPDTNKGGSWKVTNPRAEIQAMNELNNDTNKNLKKLCRIMRSWKDTCLVPISGYLLDTLAYNFMKNYKYKDKSYLYYNFLSRDFFAYLYNFNQYQTYWYAPGSHELINEQAKFCCKAKLAYENSLSAIKYEEDNLIYIAKSYWRNIYGPKFPQ